MKRQYFKCLIALSITLCAYGICPPSLSEECDLSLYPDDFPDTVEELKDTCRSMKTLINCVINARDRFSCDTNLTTDMKNLMDYLEEVCEGDSPVFTAISSNLDCIIPIARNVDDACTAHSYSDKTHDILIEYIQNSNVPLTRENSDCWDDYFGVICPAVMIGIECGEEVENTVLELLENIDYSLRSCPKDLLKEMRPIKQIFKLAVIEERKVEIAIKKRK